MDMTRKATREVISSHCKQLKLSQRVVSLCEEQATYEQEAFLCQVFQGEVDQREKSRKARALSRAMFPTFKTLEGFDTSGIQFPTGLTLDDLAKGTYIQKARNLIFYGSVGTGKTHLAIALGLLACEAGYTVRFYTMTDLVTRLGDAHRQGRLERVMKEIQATDLLILDEWGYIPVDRQGSQLLFRVIADCYERKSLILTTNLEFSSWGNIFTDEQMAAAMIDRLVHHGYLMIFGGPSYRITNALMRQNPAADWEVTRGQNN